MRFIALAAVLALLGSAAHAAPTLVDFATVSMSAPGVPRTVTDTVCATDGSDLVCDRGVYITSQSNVGIGNTNPQHRLSVSGTASINADLGGGNYSYTDISGGSVELFRATSGTTVHGYIDFKSGSLEDFDVRQYYDGSTNRLLFVNSSVDGIGTNAYPMLNLSRNGTAGVGISYPSTSLHVNGSVRVGVETSATLAVCDANRTGAIRYTGGDFSFCRNGSAWETLTSLGGGASKLASLTDVTTSGAVSGSVLAFNAATSSWTALPIQQVMSTTTMISGWPDAIRCNANPNTHAITFLLVYNYYSGVVYYRYAQAAGVATEYGIAFNATDGSYQSANSNLPGYDVNCANRSIAQLYAEGKAFNFIGSANASGSTALGDRITSGTASGVVAMAGGTISFTTGGTSGTAYLDTVGRFVGAGVSTTGAISATSIYAGTALQLASPTAVTTCTSTAAGTIRYNSPTTTLELCTGSGWQPMGVGIPAGTISAFASTTCPTGWSEYTAARGRFLRGIDNGAGNDTDGTRAPGSFQGYRMSNHKHVLPMGFDGGNFYGWQDASGVPIFGSAVQSNTNRTIVNATTNNVVPVRLGLSDVETLTGGETRPVNVAVTFCQFNGTSNGWNNPLSGGSTTAAGSTGQLQYNTAGAFDASAGLTWTNASSLLGVAGTVSTTSITVGGLTLQQIMASATTAQGDRITSGTSAVAVNSATGIVSITQLGAVTSYVHPSLGYVGPGVSATGTVSGSRVATNDVKLRASRGRYARQR